ncbi:MAG TPA: NUDIX domain-containing protein [Rhizobiaceae bacterium]|nr:NUDIX domain-containing protein [Rhizobiaceae bacterium]
MAKASAGLLVYRRRETGLEVLLVHPGGPFWAKRDRGAWSIPKGEYAESEDPEAAARREFEEELGVDAPASPLRPLGEIVQAGGKRVVAFAAEVDLDTAAIRSNEFEMEWPPKSGRRQSFPEVDRAEWFGLAEARERILPGQAPLLDRLTAAAAAVGH